MTHEICVLWLLEQKWPMKYQYCDFLWRNHPWNMSTVTSPCAEITREISVLWLYSPCAEITHEVSALWLYSPCAENVSGSAVGELDVQQGVQPAELHPRVAESGRECRETREWIHTLAYLLSVCCLNTPTPPQCSLLQRKNYSLFFTYL